MKKNFFLISFIFCFLTFYSFSQERYSIDIKQKERRVPIKYYLSETKTKFIEAKEWRKNNRLERRESRRTRKKTYSKQSKRTKKRMKELDRDANIFNRGKVPLSVKLRYKLYKWTN